MELKSLKIFGFKSFPDETKIEFEPGITAIVGPNGCGKSNIVEAIRWALGEQSMHSLRADNNEQLIFNGSQTRKPLGVAEVSLTFSNTDDYSLPSVGGSDGTPLTFSEITVTRRIFRSGESEYFINRVPCRLKDITEIFMDTGLGVNAYSIISQEQVDMVLNAKPEERRFIFEEAAGITKYSKRKNESLRKLELTSQNLLRIQDIISELERQSNSLKRQAYKARKYQQLREELKNMQVLDAFYHYKQIKEEKAKVDGGIENFGKEKTDIYSVFKKEEDSFRELHDQLAKLEVELEQKREEQLRLAAEIERCNSTIAVNEERIKNLTSKLEDGNVEKTKLDSELALISEQIETHTKTIESAKEEKEELTKSLEEISKTLKGIFDKAKENAQKLEEKNSELIEYLSEQARVKNSLENSKHNLHNLEIRFKKLTDEKEEIDQQKVSLEQELTSKNEELAQNKDVVEKTSAKIKTLEKTVAKVEGGMSATEDEIIVLKSELHTKKLHLSTLKDIHSKDEGIHRAVKFIMESDESASDMHGLISNVLEVPEGLQKAVEVALRDNIQGLIVKDHNSVSKFIELLKEREEGRATFLPVENIQPRPKKDFDAGVNYEFAIDKVKFPKQFTSIFSYLLDKVVIARDWDEAMKLYSSLSEEYRIVTLDGELLHPKGFIQGGSGNQMHALLGRKERIDKMDREVIDIDGRLKNMEQKKTDEFSRVREIEEELRQNRGEVKVRNERSSQLEKEIGSVTEKIEEFKRRDKFLADENKNLESEKEILVQKSKDYKKELKKIQEKIDKYNLAIDSVKKTSEELNEEEKETNELLESKRINLFSLKQSSKNAEEALETLTEKKKMLLETIPDVDVEKEEARARMQSLKKELKESKAKLEENQEKIESLKENLEKLKEKRLLLNEQSREKEKFIRDRESELENRKDSLQSLEVERVRLETEMKDLKENIHSNHGVSLDEFTPPETETTEENLRGRVEDLKDKLDRMGNINLAAIEEEEELNERYNFYLTQQKDLLDSQQSLRDTINKINSTARSLFRDTLENVRKEFRDVFINLFQGGEADLRLVGSQDVLESGIDIVVSPPGKKLSTISLLSGGEKALTSIALLFSLFKVKPSPFCVLDEIDASLDESNIGRFTNFLKDLVKDTQFIIVSHNKRTLSISEILYGITMEDPGVSKMVSVKFTPHHRGDAGLKKKPTASPKADKTPVYSETSSEVTSQIEAR